MVLDTFRALIFSSAITIKRRDLRYPLPQSQESVPLKSLAVFQASRKPLGFGFLALKMTCRSQLSGEHFERKPDANALRLVSHVRG